MSLLVDIVSGLVPLAAGGAGLTKAFVIIREGEGGLHLRAGKYMRNLAPGLHVVLPWYDMVLRKNVRQTNQELPSQSVLLKDGTAYMVQATILYRIADLKHALLEVTNVDYTITHAGQAIVREVVSGVARQELLDSAEMNRRLQEKAEPLFAQWGVQLEKFMLSDVEPTPGTAALLLREAEADMQVATNERLLRSLKEQQELIREANSHGGGVVMALLMRGSAAPNLNMPSHRQSTAETPSAE